MSNELLTTKEFLLRVITAKEEGWFCLAVGNGSGWLEQWHKWPEQIDEIVKRAEQQMATANVYFSSYLFKAPQSTKDTVLQTRTIQADLDNADVTNLPIAPTVLVESSPGRHQAFWVLNEAVRLEEHEALSKKLTYSIPLCDRSGWPLGRKVRVPGTFNHKYLTGPKPVKIISVGAVDCNIEEFEALPEVPQYLVDHYSSDFLENPKGSETSAHELLAKIENRLPTKVYISFDTIAQDRSEALWALMCYAFKAGLKRDEVFTLAKASANNKFADLQHRADQDLAKDVLRAEATVNSSDKDARQIVHDLFKNQISSIERKRQIFAVVLSTMKAQGEFLHTNNGLAWYIRRDTGRPIQVTANSEKLSTMLDVQFGLNYTEPEARYVAHSLRAFSDSVPDTAIQSALGYYDEQSGALLLHTGRRTVLRITPDKVEQIVDGAYSLIFPWSNTTEPFVAALPRENRHLDWGDELFGNGTRGFGSSVENLTNMRSDEALALLKVWFMFLLFRNLAASRPIIATFGQPGSGKSTLFKKIYLLLYGRFKALGAVTTVDDFDHVTSQDPLVVLDNVDTWERWLPDRIALSAGTSDVTRRKLYTDFDTVTFKRQALVGVTAHNPKFGREDVADRFLLFSYRRFDKFIGETLIYDDLFAKRNLIWGAIVADIQKILATPIPISGIPQFRVEDFARVGLWLARGMGIEDRFVSSITDVRSAQQAFSLEEEGMLVNAILKFASTQSARKEGPQFYTTSQMWSMIEMCSDDPKAFASMYKNSVALSKKLSSMESALKRVVYIEQQTNTAGSKMWKIHLRDEKGK